MIGGLTTSRVMRLRLTDDGKVDHLSDGPALPKSLYFARVIGWNGWLIVTGGLSHDGPQNGTYILNTTQSPASWIKGPSLSTARYFHFSFLLGDKVFVGCGDSYMPDLSSIEVMDLSHTPMHWTHVTENYPIKVTITTSMLALQQYIYYYYKNN